MGVFRGLQSLQQLLIPTGATSATPANGNTGGNGNGGGCGVAAATIEDWPDTAYRGTYMYGGWYVNVNQSLVFSLLENTDG